MTNTKKRPGRPVTLQYETDYDYLNKHIVEISETVSDCLKHIRPNLGTASDMYRKFNTIKTKLEVLKMGIEDKQETKFYMVYIETDKDSDILTVEDEDGEEVLREILPLHTIRTGNRVNTQEIRKAIFETTQSDNFEIEFINE